MRAAVRVEENAPEPDELDASGGSAHGLEKEMVHEERDVEPGVAESGDLMVDEDDAAPVGQDVLRGEVAVDEGRGILAQVSREGL